MEMVWMLLRGKVRETQGEMFMKTKLCRSIASLLIVTMTGCAGPHKLARDDQLSRSSQPRIYAVHHRPATVFVDRETIPAAVLPDTPSDPSASENARLKREQPEDPAPHVKSRLVRTLQAHLKLTNVDTTTGPLQNDDDIKTHKDAFKTGVVLDVRTMKWGRDDSRGYYSVRARMVRLEDSSVLWKTTCSARWFNDGEPLQAQLRIASDDCAAQLSAKALGKDQPVSVTGRKIPAEGLPGVPQIVADEQSIDLPGLEMTPEERALFDDERSARIDRRAQVSISAGDKAKGIALCIVPPLCAVVWAVAGAMMGVTWGIKRAIVSAREPSLIPEKDSTRLAAML